MFLFVLTSAKLNRCHLNNNASRAEGVFDTPSPMLDSKVPYTLPFKGYLSA